jgi:hypothetical protein
MGIKLAQHPTDAILNQFDFIDTVDIKAVNDHLCIL